MDENDTTKGTEQEEVAAELMAAKNISKKRIRIFAGITVIIFMLAVITILAVGNSPARKLEKQLALAQKYLTELDYEQAIAAFETAISIDPKNVDAYVGLAEVYTEMGDLEKAKKVLEKGYAQNEDAEIERKLAEIQGKLDELTKLDDLAQNSKEQYETQKEVQEPEELDEVSIICASKWVREGFRLSDSMQFEFYKDGSFDGMFLTDVPAGIVYLKGTYLFDGKQLQLYDEDENLFDELLFDVEQECFKSKMLQKMTEQDYVDEKGVYHEAVYQPYTLSKSEEADETMEVTSITDISNLSEIVHVYEQCENQRFCVEYDRDQRLPDSFDGVDWFYLVTTPMQSIGELKTYLKDYVTEAILEEYWTDSCIKENDGKLYYRPGNAGYVSYRAEEAVLLEANGTKYEVLIPQYGSGDNYVGQYQMTIQKGEQGFRLAAITKITNE